VRAVLPIDGSENRICSVRGVPSLTDHLEREAHTVRRLMTAYTSPTVLPDRLEEWMICCLHRSIGVQNAEAAKLILILEPFRDLPWLARAPPFASGWRT